MTIYLLSLMHVKNCVSLIILLRENKRVKLWHVSNPRMLVVQWVDDNFFKNQQTFQYEQFQHTHVHTKYIMLYVMLCYICYIIYWAVLAGQWQRILLIKETQETRVWSLGREYTLEKEIAVHSSILTWKIPWTEKPGGLQFMELQRVRNIWDSEHEHIYYILYYIL